MSITRETVLHIAELARLRLEDDEVESLKGDLDKILSHVAELEGIDTSNVPPTLQMSQGGSRRPDRVVSGLTQEQALSEAPRSIEGGFAVPGFVDES
jgi:aspartyl-tRNA(Asn)/glutamyl-tRNA(Gln) amidotransferase subunit C